MNSKLRNITICILLGMSCFTLNASANNINKLDIKRSVSSSSTLNMTIFTDNPYDENVAVTKKSDNKYVVLMPNISGASNPSIDFSTIQDVVSDVNVRTVEDGANGYTKVTLTTTKPVAITTSTRKSAPLTAEQKAYKNLIGQAKGYKVTDPLDDFKIPPAPSKADTNVKPKAETKQVAEKSTVSNKSKASDNKTASAPKEQVRQRTVISQVKNIISGSDNNKSNVKSDNKTNTSKQAKSTEKVAQSVALTSNASNEGVGQKDATLKDLRNDIIRENQKSDVKNTTPASESSVADYSNNVTTQTDKNNKNKNLSMILSLMGLLAIGGLFAFFKSIKKSLDNSLAMERSYVEGQIPNIITPEYDDISVDEELGWQDRYRQFLESAEEINPSEGTLRHIGNGEYEFVSSADLEPEQSEKIFKVGYGKTSKSYGKKSNLKPKTESKLKSYNRPAMNSSPKGVPPIKKVKNQNLRPSSAPKLEIVENKYDAAAYKELEASLERTLHNSPSKERIDLNDELMINPSRNVSPIVHSEGDSISKSIRKSPKLKSFANKVALEQTRRNMPMPKSSSEIVKSSAIESKYVNLDNSTLYSSARKFANANLNSSNLIAKSSINTRPKVSEIKDADNNEAYSTLSVDEFFDSIDSSSRVTAPVSLSSRVADSLMKISAGYKKPTAKTVSSSQIMADMNVINSYKIDETSGFYIVEGENGTSSLIGRVGKNLTMLKTFSNMLNTKLQVREDGQNVYMVRVGSDRFLVELNENKAGVLLEL